MLTEKKIHIAKLLASNWYIGTHSTQDIEAIGKISHNVAELAMEIGDVELSVLVYQFYEELEEKEGT